MSSGHKGKTRRMIHRSRKAFYAEYTCALILTTLLLISSIMGVNLPTLVYWFVVLFIIIIVVYAEADRVTTSYRLMDDKMIITDGILKKHRKNVYYHPLGFVTDINVHQGRIQRLLGVGTIYVKAGGSENSFEIKDVDQPYKILDYMEKLIHREVGKEKRKANS